MKTSISLLIVATLVLFVGCAHQPLPTWNKPIVDMKGVDQAKFDADYQECVTYAFQAPGPGTGATAGAIVGAGVGYLLTRLAGGDLNRGEGARFGAGVGAIGGAAGGAQNEAHVVKQCLRGRGYNVLN